MSLTKEQANETGSYCVRCDGWSPEPGPQCPLCGYGEPPEMGLRERDERDRASELAAIGRGRMR